MTRAPLATAQRIAFASASTGIDRCGPTTFAIRSSAGGASPAIPTPSSVCAAIRPATNVPCPWVSTVGRPGDEALRRRDPAAQLGMGAVDARVDHGDPDRRERRQLGPGVERAVLRRVPLARQERVVRDERLPAGSAAPRRSARRQRRAAPPRRGAETASGRDRGEVDDRRSRRARASCRTTAARSAPGAIPTANRAASAVGATARRAQRPRRRAAALARHFGCPAGTVIVSAGPTWPSAVSRYVAVAFGRTVTANEPSSAGATLTDGSPRSGRRRASRAAGASTSRASPETTTGVPAAVAAGGRADPQDAEPERRRPQPEPRPHVGGREQHPGAGLLDERDRRGAAGRGRDDHDVDDGGREPERLGERGRGERARRPAVVRRERVPRVVAGLEIRRHDPEDVLARGRPAARGRVVERRRDLAGVREDLAAASPSRPPSSPATPPRPRSTSGCAGRSRGRTAGS